MFEQGSIFRKGGETKRSSNPYWYKSYSELWDAFDGDMDKDVQDKLETVMLDAEGLEGSPDDSKTINAYYLMLRNQPESKKSFALADLYAVFAYYGNMKPDSPVFRLEDGTVLTVDDVKRTLNKALESKRKDMKSSLTLEEIEQIKAALPKIVYDELVADAKASEEPKKETSDADRKALMEKRLKLLEFASKTVKDEAQKGIIEKKIKLLKFGLKAMKFKKGGQVSAKKNRLKEFAEKHAKTNQ